MRIISGKLKNKPLHSPPDSETTRPLPARVRQSIFGLMRGHLEGGRVFDGFAGTGSFGIEAASRGAAQVVMVERDRKIGKLLERNVSDLGVGDVCDVVNGDALGPGALARCPRPVDIVLLDPPYPLVEDPHGWNRVRTQLMRLIDLLADDGFAMVRTPWPFRHPVEGAVGASEPADTDDGEDGEMEIIDLDDPEAEEKLEAWDRELEDAARRASRQQHTPKRDVDLTLENAVGPETHVYRHTAVHLYMRKRDDDAGN